MRTYPINDEHGRMVAFEVPSAYFGVRTIARLLSAVEEVTDVRRRRLFGQPDDVHVIFQYRGAPHMVWEPYGDNSRYWIGPKEAIGCGEVAALHAAFRQYRPSVLRWLLGTALDLFSMEWVPKPKQ